jgi:hypothetical protein
LFFLFIFFLFFTEKRTLFSALFPLAESTAASGFPRSLRWRNQPLSLVFRALSAGGISR